MLKTILITGANAGLGKDSARQLAAKAEVQKIYLGCRNPEKAKQAKFDLQRITGRDIFEILPIDVSDLASVRKAVDLLPEAVDALILNAGGTGGQKFYELTEDGVSRIFAVNLLGHVALTQGLIEAGKLKDTVLYAGSEAARGVPEMGMKRPQLNTNSVEEYIAIANGSLFGKTNDATVPYGPIKYMAAMWMSEMARKHPEIRFVTMSPGATTGTEGFETLSAVRKFVMKNMMKVMLLLGKVHKLEVGAARYVDGLFNDAHKTGGFYASKKGLTGTVGDQTKIFPDLANPTYQTNAASAIQSFLK